MNTGTIIALCVAALCMLAMLTQEIKQLRKKLRNKK